MSNFGAVSIDAIAERGAISAADVLALRKSVYGGTDNISKKQAEEIIELDRVCTVLDPAWSEFFVEAITDHIVEQTEPRGYITVENALWLINQLQNGERAQTARAMELLANILDKSRWSPTALVQFAITEVKHTILEGAGRMQDGSELEPGVIGEADVELLRRILFAFGGDGNIAITKPEAELLFELNELTSEADNHPSWTDLFAKSIANYVMGASGYRVPNREEALRHESWLNESDMDTGLFITQMVEGGLKGIWSAYNQQTQEERELAHLEKEKIRIITAEVITEDEASWLADGILRDGELTENEKALLAFIREQSPSIHPDLEPLLAEAA